MRLAGRYFQAENASDWLSALVLTYFWINPRRRSELKKRKKESVKPEGIGSVYVFLAILHPTHPSSLQCQMPPCLGADHSHLLAALDACRRLLCAHWPRVGTLHQALLGPWSSALHRISDMPRSLETTHRSFGHGPPWVATNASAG